MRKKWREVTSGAPCPACRGSDWCAWSPDGDALKCERVSAAPAGMSLLKMKGTGAIFKMQRAEISRMTEKLVAQTAATNSAVVFRQKAIDYANAIDDDQVQLLADELGVSVPSLRAIRIGWASVSELRLFQAGGAGWDAAYPDGAYAFPETGASGDTIGFSFRAIDGRKGAPASSAGARRGLVVPTTLCERSPVLVVEGASDVAACETMGLAAVGRPSNTGGAEILASLMRCREVFVVGEADAKENGRFPGGEGANSIAAQLAQAWNSQVWWALPPDAKDVRAWLRVQEGDPEQLGARFLAEITRAAKPSRDLNEKPDDRPEILLDTEEHRAVDEVAGHIHRDDGIYCRGGLLVRLVADEYAGKRISLLTRDSLRTRMTRIMRFKRYDPDGEAVKCHPAPWLIAGVDDLAEWPNLRSLRAISTVPVVRADGSVWEACGYDAVSGVYYAGKQIAIGHVTQDAALAATGTLLDAVASFPFDSEESRSAWLAALLTPFARFAFDGATPLFLIDANVRGAGKSLLAQIIGRILLGADISASSYSHDPVEMRKLITSIAIGGDRVILFDNIDGPFGNDALDRALTSTRWKDRILGKSEEVELPLMPTWYATGNNVLLAGDIARRIVHIRLDCAEENPEDRSFDGPPILGAISRRRGELVRAAVLIVAAYLQAGRPHDNTLRPIGSFEGWSSVVREAIVWVGLVDPCAGRDRMAEVADSSRDVLGQLFDAWGAYDAFGLGRIVSQMLAELYPTSGPRPNRPEDIAMRAALEALVDSRSGSPPTARSVGNRLKKYRGRVVGGRRLVLEMVPKSGARWFLEAVSGAETA